MPALLEEAAGQLARAEAVGFIDSIGDQIVRGSPFTAVLGEEEANRWLAVLGDVWPDAAEAIPKELTLPAVRFETGRLRAGAHLRSSSGWQAIVSVQLLVRVSDDGAELEWALTSFHIGAIPVPRYVLGVIADRLLKSDANRFTTLTPHVDGSDGDTVLSDVERMFGGVRLRNRFVWFNGQRPFRIRSIRLTNGQLHVEIEPLVSGPR